LPKNEKEDPSGVQHCVVCSVFVATQQIRSAEVQTVAIVVMWRKVVFQIAFGARSYSTVERSVGMYAAKEFIQSLDEASNIIVRSTAERPY
jgi:hypothetical protein